MTEFRDLKANSDTKPAASLATAARLGLPIVAFCLFGALLLVSRQPAISADSLTLAEAELGRGNYSKAIQLYEELAGSGRATDAAKRDLLRALFKTGQYQRVEELAARYATASPTEAGFYLLLGRALEATGRYEKAEAAFKKGFQGSGLLALESHLRLGLLLEQTGRTEESRAEFSRIYENAAQSPDGRSLVAVALQHLDRFQEANSLFRDFSAAHPDDVEALNRWGDLFLEKYDKANAASVFQDALKVNPNEPDSLIGLARCSSEEEGAHVDKLIAKSLAVNRAFEPAFLLRGELLIQSEEFEEAAEQIKKALETNSASLEALSLKAVLSSANENAAELEQNVQVILAVNPHYGQVYQDLADFAVTQRFYQQAVDYYKKAIELSPTLWTAYSGLGINLLRLGKEAEAKQALETSYANDRFNVWTVNTLRLIDSYENFQSVEVPNFRLRLHNKEANLLRLYVPGLLEEVFDTLTARYRYRPPTPLYLEMYPDHEDFAVRTLGLPGLGALGVCFGPGMVMDSPSARPKGTFNWGSTLWHEFTHVITLGMTEHRVPRWFSEGLSVMEEHRARPGWGDDITLEAMKGIQDRKLLPISDLNRGFQQPRFPGQVQLSYFQAGQACEFIEKEFGFAKILEMLEGFRRGEKLEQVLTSVLGVSPAQFDAGFNRFITARYGRTLAGLNFQLLEQKDVLESPEKLEALLAAEPDNFFANLKMAAMYRSRRQTDRAIACLERAKAVFPAYDKEDNPYRQLAEIHKEQGNLGAAIADLQAAATNGSDFESLKLLATWLKEASRNEQAVPILEKAIYLYPFDPEIHELFAAAARPRDLPVALREYQAILALDPVDKAAAHFRVAGVLFELGRASEAKKEVLAALEIAPGFQAAQELLLRLSE